MACIRRHMQCGVWLVGCWLLACGLPGRVAARPRTGDGVVRFVYADSAATAVHLVGDFNGWNPTATPLDREVDGSFAAQVFLDPGTYEYKFLRRRHLGAGRGQSRGVGERQLRRPRRRRRRGPADRGRGDGGRRGAGCQVSVASKEYRRAASDGTQEQVVTVEIADGGFAEMISAPFEMMAQMSSETTEGYQKGITVAGYPSYEQWTIATRRSELNALVAKRFMIHLTGSQVEPSELRQWLEGMKLAELAKLAAER